MHHFTLVNGNAHIWAKIHFNINSAKSDKMKLKSGYLEHRFSVEVFWYPVYQARLWERLLTTRGLPIYTSHVDNTRWGSFDIKFTRQGFENACWHREACRAIQQAFSKPSLVNLISKNANLVYYLSVYTLLNTLQTNDYDVFLIFVLIQRH